MQVFLLILLIVLWVILSPMIIFWTFKLSKKKASIIMQKRHIRLSLFSCCLCITQVFVGVPLFICVTFSPLHKSHAWVCAVDALHSVFIYGVLYLLFIRFFMFYFHMNWTAVTLCTRAHWIIHIRKPSTNDKTRDSMLRTLEAADPSDPCAHFNLLSHPDPHTIANPATISLHHRIKFRSDVLENWFIKSRRRYGSVPTVSVYFYLVVISVLTFLLVLAEYKQTSIWSICFPVIGTLSFILPTCGIIYLWTKTPTHIHDTFFIRQELRPLLMVDIISCVVYTWNAILMIMNQFVTIGEEMIYLKIINATCVILLCSATVYFQTEWLLNRINKRMETMQCAFYSHLPPSHARFIPISDDESPYSRGFVASGASASAISTSEVEEKYDAECICEAEKYKYRMLFHVLQSGTLLGDFSRHLATELSMECLFAFIEFTQFKCLLERDLYYNPSTQTHSKLSMYSYNAVQLPRIISRSSIVHNRKYAAKTPRERYKKIANKLAQKYLDAGAEFELPIHRETKRRVRQLLRAAHHPALQLANDSSDDLDSIGLQHAKYVDSFDSYDCFEDCRSELYELMHHSLQRMLKYEAAKRN